MANNSWCACLWCIYIGLAHYYSIAVGYLYFAIYILYNTDTECTRAIASTLIHAVVLCESAQRYRALMVFLKSHRMQNMILRDAIPTYLLYFGDIPNLVSCAFSTIPIFPPFNSQNFLFTCLCSFFNMLCSIRREHSSRSFAPPKNGYLVWSRGASSARAHVGRRI